MVEIGLFPLELVLLPGEHLSLHIFEARERTARLTKLLEQASAATWFSRTARERVVTNGRVEPP